MRFGDGNRSIILTARHHACESTGSYVLEGVLDDLIDNPIEGFQILCVPFVDYDGVIDGDQGKNRVPHGHNRDYSDENPPIFPETSRIIEYTENNNVCYGFDFHSPWHRGWEHDNVYIVQSSIEKLVRLDLFGEILEKSITDKAMRYWHKNDYPPETGWNRAGSQFAAYLNDVGSTL